MGPLFHMENERAFESINFIGVIYMSHSAGNMQNVGILWGISRSTR